VEINWRTTKLQTKTNDCIIIPNGTISKTELINYYEPTPLHMDKIKLARITRRRL